MRALEASGSWGSFQPMRQIDLEPDEYRPEPRPNEPVFGAGWPVAVAVVLSIVVAAIAHSAGAHAIVSGLLAVFVGALAFHFFSALVSDRQLQVRPPPRDPIEPR